MKMVEVAKLKKGDKLFVSYKGIRPCEFVNTHGKCAFIIFDSGDGTGKRLHRVLATTLQKAKKEVKKTEVKKIKVAEGLSTSQLSELQKALKTLEGLGFECEFK